MKISAINGLNPTKVNKKSFVNFNRENKGQYTSNAINMPNDNYGKAQIGLNKKYNPSFGFDLFTLGMIGYALLYAGILGAGVYQTNLDEKKRAEESRKLEQETQNSINSISQKLNVSYDEAKDYHYSFLRLADIPFQNNGHERGLNAVQGYGVEKYRLSMDVIAPIVAKSKDQYLGYNGKVPNGVLLYGPTGGGKTYISDKVCDHLKYLGLPVEDIELDENNHAKNVRNIQNAFKKAEETYNQTGKITMINFKQDVDNFFLDRRNHPECIKEVRALLKCMENCAEKGAVWIGTANNPQMIDSALLRPGRTDVKLPIGDMQDFAVADMIKYSLFKYDEKESAKDFDYQKVLDNMKDNLLVFTPAELELFVIQAINHKLAPSQHLSADMIIAEMEHYSQNDFPTLTEEMKQRFKEDKIYMTSLESSKKGKKS